MSEFDNNPFLLQQGWQCPVCKRVYSPSTPMCMCCGNGETTINTGNHLVMRDFTKEEQEEYNKVLDKLYEPTGLNLFDIGVKNNFNKIKRYNKDELAEFITDLTNYGKYPCANCGYYGGDDSYDYCPNDCVQGVKLWLEKEVSE